MVTTPKGLVSELKRQEVDTFMNKNRYLRSCYVTSHGGAVDEMLHAISVGSVHMLVIPKIVKDVVFEVTYECKVYTTVA